MCISFSFLLFFLLFSLLFSLSSTPLIFLHSSSPSLNLFISNFFSSSSHSPTPLLFSPPPLSFPLFFSFTLHLLFPSPSLSLFNPRRFIHHFTRFQAHGDSGALEIKMHRYRIVKRIMAILHDLAGIDER